MSKKIIFLLSANDYGGVTKFSLNLIEELQKKNFHCSIHIPFFTHFYYTKHLRAQRDLTDIKMWTRYFLGQFRLELKERKLKFCGEKLNITSIKATRYFFSPDKKSLQNADFVVIQQSTLLQQILDIGVELEKIIVVVHHRFTNNPLDLQNKEGMQPKIVASSVSTRLALSELGATEIDTIPLGVDTIIFNPKNRTRFEDSYINIGFYYHPHARKNPELVKFLILYFVTYQEIKFRVHVFGHKFKTDHEFSNLRFYQQLPEIQYSQEIANLDIFVFCSKMEGFGLPPLEAMASGISVIASRAGAAPEYLDNDSGVILDLESSPSIWIDAILRVSLSQELRKQFSINAPIRAKEFTWTKTAEAYISLLDTLDSRR